MKLRNLMGGLLAVGLLTAGCGGTVPEEMGAEQGLSQAEQELIPACAPGYTAYSEWDCARVCGTSWGNYLTHYCTNGTDTYAVATGAVRCGACY